MQNPFLTGMGAALWLASALLAQAPPAAAVPNPPAFEVASIKPAGPMDPAKLMQGKMHVGMSVDAARVDIGFASMADLIRLAYKVKRYQVSGPDWMSAQRFDILAKMPEGVSKDLVPQMIQALLAERFKLVVHRESKESPVYALVVGKNGPKMKEAAPPDVNVPAPPPEAASSKPAMTIPTPEGDMRVSPSSDGRGGSVSGGPFGQMKFSVGEGGAMHLEFASVSMTGLADILTRFADRPVVDFTEIKGNYQVVLELSMDEMRNVMRATASQMGMPVPPGGGRGGGDGARPPSDAASTPSGSSILGAVQQLGLKMEGRKSPVDMVIVDHVEKTPTEN